MGEREQIFEISKARLEKLNRDILQLEKEIAGLKDVVIKMERDNRASVRPDTDDLQIIMQIREEDKIKDQIHEMKKRLQVLLDEKERLQSQQK